MNVRPALPSESEALSALASAAKSHWGYSAAQLAAWADDLRVSQESIQSEPTFVMEDEGRIAGVVQLHTKKYPWAIEHLWVHPSATRRGVGSRLVQHALRYARERGQGELRVDSDPQAEQFYVRFGARRVGEIAAPIEGHTDRVRPQLIINTASTT